MLNGRRDIVQPGTVFPLNPVQSSAGKGYIKTMATKFSYKVKESIIADMQNKVEALRELLGKLKENESLAEVPDHDDLGGLNVYLSAMEKELDSLYEAVLPMAFFEKKSA